jgi:hypothetical protein
METHVISRKWQAEPRLSHSDSELRRMDNNQIPTADDSDHLNSNVELDQDALEVAPAIDPAYEDDINSELQDRGIGVASDAFILKNGIGQKSANPESHMMYQWAKGSMPNLNTALLHVEETYGVVPQRLSKLYQLITCRWVGAKCQKKNKSCSRREKGTMKYGMLVPNSPEKAKEIDRENGSQQIQEVYRKHWFLGQRLM